VQAGPPFRSSVEGDAARARRGPAAAPWRTSARRPEQDGRGAACGQRAESGEDQRRHRAAVAPQLAATASRAAGAVSTSPDLDRVDFDVGEGEAASVGRHRAQPHPARPPDGLQACLRVVAHPPHAAVEAEVASVRRAATEGEGAAPVVRHLAELAPARRVPQHEGPSTPASRGGSPPRVRQEKATLLGARTGNDRRAPLARSTTSSDEALRPREPSAGPRPPPGVAWRQRRAGDFSRSHVADVTRPPTATSRARSRRPPAGWSKEPTAVSALRSSADRPTAPP
jgi:hypothetical protein